MLDSLKLALYGCDLLFNFNNLGKAHMAYN